MVFLLITGAALIIGIWILASIKLGEYIAEYYIGEAWINSSIIAIVLFALAMQILTFIYN